jgi:hypothetical protein
MVTLVAIASKIKLRQHFFQHLIAYVNEELFDPYHPERHYMRGPGPKWRQAHGHVKAKQRAEQDG